MEAKLHWLTDAKKKKEKKVIGVTANIICDREERGY